MQKKAERKFYLEQFKAISYAIATYEDPNTLMNHLVEGTTRSFGAKGCSIMLLEEKTNELAHIASYGISEEYLGKGTVFFDMKNCALCVGEPVFVEDMQHDPRVQYPKAAAKEGITTMLSIPIHCREAIIGILRIYHAEPCQINEEDVDALGVLTSLLGVVIENHGLKNFLEHVKMALGSLPLRMLKGL
ncbi:MAG: GAF domain-containing protein [Deltaproteobacteria bacterium]|nr:GAF domain-containing protein [Deltaproteobacteria bacterium]